MSGVMLAAEGAVCASGPSSAAAERRAGSGVIVLARHGEPAISRKVRLNACEYAAWWARYEETGLRPGQIAPADLRALAACAGALLASNRPRSIESAKALAPDRAIEIDPDLVEAPLPPPRWPDWLKLSPRIWGVVSRTCWWFLDHHEGQESRAAAQLRAEAVADMLIRKSENGDVLAVAHGFFNAMIGRSLKARGWSLAQDQGFRYWSSRRFVLRRD